MLTKKDKFIATLAAFSSVGVITWMLTMYPWVGGVAGAIVLAWKAIKGRPRVI